MGGQAGAAGWLGLALEGDGVPDGLVGGEQRVEVGMADWAVPVTAGAVGAQRERAEVDVHVGEVLSGQWGAAVGLAVVAHDDGAGGAGLAVLAAAVALS